MLRYYEQVGLLTSGRKDDYAYRVYDANALVRLQQIIILRKLQIPIKQIAVILNNPNAATAIEILKANISEIQAEINALTTIKTVLEAFADKIEKLAAVRLNLNLLTDESVVKLVDSLSLVQKNIKEITAMENLNKASEQLEKRTDVRIVHLPPFTVAVTQSFGKDHEQEAYDAISQFAKVTNLLAVKPDARSFGFNVRVNGKHGYEAWATIPADMDVPAPFAKKTFAGGLYACHTRAFQDLNNDEVSTINEWLDENDEYCHDRRDPVGIYGSIEEHFVFGPFSAKRTDLHIDFFIPIKRLMEKRQPAKLGYIEGSEEKCGFKASLVKKDHFYVTGYTKMKIGDEDNNIFYTEITNDGRLGRLKAALKPGAPIMVYGSYDNDCVQAQKKYKVFCHKITICAARDNFVDTNNFKGDDIFTTKVASKHWIEFELPRRNQINLKAHDAVKQLGWKFSGKGHFEVYYDGEILLNDENKDNIMHFWMPVVCCAI
jgi:DNA-binding transcriptional MerR regulator